MMMTIGVRIYPVASIPMGQGGNMSPNISLEGDIHMNDHQCLRTSSLETACFSIHLTANASIFSARNLRLITQCVVFWGSLQRSPRPSSLWGGALLPLAGGPRTTPRSRPSGARTRHVARIVSLGGSFSVWGQTYFEYYYTAIAC